jgi:hypothetical protein
MTETKVKTATGSINPDNVEVGDVFQVSPETDNELFGGSMLIVSEVKSFGVQGYVQVLHEGGGQAYVRVKWKDLAYVGKAVWTV